ncbi:unnamed protein product [Ixodes hexagonus]
MADTALEAFWTRFESCRSSVPVCRRTALAVGVVAVRRMPRSRSCSEKSRRPPPPPGAPSHRRRGRVPDIFWTTSFTSCPKGVIGDVPTFINTFWTSTRWLSRSVVRLCSKVPISARALR